MHLDPEALTQLLLRLVPPQVEGVEGAAAEPPLSRAALRELLTCAFCRRRFHDAFEAVAPSHPASGTGSNSLDRVLETAGKIHRATEKQRKEEIRLAEPLFRELVALPEKSRHDGLESDSRFHRPAVAHWLLAAAEDASAGDPNPSLHLAKLALHLLELSGPSPDTSRLLARGYCLAADAHRRRGELESAGNALRSAERELDGEPLATPARAVLCLSLGALRAAEQRFDEGLSLLIRAGALFEDLADFDNLARVLLEEGWLRLEESDHEGAALNLQEAFGLLNPHHRPHLVLSALHALGLCYADLGRSQALSEVQTFLTQMTRFLPLPVDKIRIRWIRAQINARLGLAKTAVPQLDGVLRDLTRLDGAADEAAMAAVELARILLDRYNEAPALPLARLLQSLKPLALSGKLAPRLWRVTAFAIRFASHRQGLYLEVLDEARRYLERAQFNPELEYHPLPEPDDGRHWHLDFTPEERQALAQQATLSPMSDLENPPPQEREILGWTLEALTGIRIFFPRDLDVSDDTQPA